VETLVGMCAFDLMHADDVPRVVEEFRQSTTTPQAVRRAEYRVRHRDGSWRTFEGVARNALDDPQVRGVIITSRDIGERRSAAWSSSVW
jgi:PAS domain S-box-containing protein